MFGIKHNECVGFDSRWKVTKVRSESTSQTDNFSTQDQASNTNLKQNDGVQTENASEKQEQQTDFRRLSDWLEKIYPTVKTAMDDVVNSRAFLGYKLQGDRKQSGAKMVQNLQVCTVEDNDTVRKVKAVTWNCNGRYLAVACSFEHKNWCHHIGLAIIYPFNAKEGKFVECSKKPISTSNCISCIKFHPKLPQILAAGTVSGELIVWNLQNAEESYLSVNESVLSQISNAHNDAITCLSWPVDLDTQNTVLLASSSLDGSVICWNLNVTEISNALTKKTKYKIKTPLLNKVNLIDRSTGGILCFDFSPFMNDIFMVAIEGGHLMQCSTVGASELKGSSKELPVLDPVFKYYEHVNGGLSLVKFSPNRKEMFATLGNDEKIRIYLLDQESPAQVIFTKNVLNSLTWVPGVEKLIAGCGISEILEIYHLINRKEVKNVTDDDMADGILTDLSINSKNLNVVAVGTKQGFLQLWNVPWEEYE